MKYSLDLNQVYKKIVKLSNKYYTSFINSNPSTKLFFISLFLCWFTLNFSILNIVDLSKNFWNVTLNLIENFFLNLDIKYTFNRIISLIFDNLLITIFNFSFALKIYEFIFGKNSFGSSKKFRNYSSYQKFKLPTLRNFDDSLKFALFFMIIGIIIEGSIDKYVDNLVKFIQVITFTGDYGFGMQIATLTSGAFYFRVLLVGWYYTGFVIASVSYLWNKIF